MTNVRGDEAAATVDLIPPRLLIVMYLLTCLNFVSTSTLDHSPIGGTSREVGFVVVSVAASVVVGLIAAVIRLPVKNGYHRGFSKEAPPRRRLQLAWRTSVFMAFLAGLFLFFVDLALPPCAYLGKMKAFRVVLEGGDWRAWSSAIFASALSFLFSMCVANCFAYAIAFICELFRGEKNS